MAICTPLALPSMPGNPIFQALYRIVKPAKTAPGQGHADEQEQADRPTWLRRAVSAPASTAPSRSSSGRWSAMARRSMSATRSSTIAMWLRPWRRKGAIFVEELDEIPGDRSRSCSPPMACPKRSRPRPRARNLLYLDATCPLVSKVHREAEGHCASGRNIILIGHAGHPEVIGTIGQLPEGTRVAGRDRGRRRDARTSRDPANARLSPPRPRSRSTTPIGIIAVLKRRFPKIHGPRKEDICYATTNRQAGGEGDRRELRSDAGDRGAQFLELAAAWSRWPWYAGCANAYLVQKASRDRLGLVRRHQDGRHHGRRLGAGNSGAGSDRRRRATASTSSPTKSRSPPRPRISSCRAPSPPNRPGFVAMAVYTEVPDGELAAFVQGL